MKKLIEALHVIQDECKKHDVCEPSCPLYKGGCGIKEKNEFPENWKINDDSEVQKALL
jgi:hypothetical protein